MLFNERPRLRKRLFITAVCIAIVGGILYKLADRYLIVHVEVVVAAPASSTETDSSHAADQEENVESVVKSDDWSYSSDNLSISIEQVTSGEGGNRITYYVADVKTSDASVLQSAFAKNKFGRNIIENTSEIASGHQVFWTSRSCCFFSF